MSKAVMSNFTSCKVRLSFVYENNTNGKHEKPKAQHIALISIPILSSYLSKISLRLLENTHRDITQEINRYQINQNTMVKQSSHILD